MISTKFKVEDKFGDVISKDSLSPEQITKLNNFLTKNYVSINIKIKFNLLKPRNKSHIDILPSAPLYYE